VLHNGVIVGQGADVTDDSETRSLPPSHGSSVPLEAVPSATASGIDRYRLETELGRGAFGTVFLAFDKVLKRRVALKILTSQYSGQESTFGEAQSAAGIDHPAVVTVYDVGMSECGRVYIVMQYIEGDTLEEVMQAARADLFKTIDIAARIADGLHEAHKCGLVHRDLKPANILLDRQLRPHISDFGLALHEDRQRTRRGEVAGSVPYMAPEQVRGESHQLDGRTDIWALGVILYEGITKRRPFGGPTHRDVFDEIQHREPKPPRMIDDSLPVEIERICLRCLSKGVRDRYSTASDLARDLRTHRLKGSQPGDPDDPSVGILGAMWDCLDADLQDAFSLAYNKKKRTGSRRISTRDLFQALVRVDDQVFQRIAKSLPEGALPDPIDKSVETDGTVLQERPSLSDCVAESLREFKRLSPLPRRISVVDIFVDIGIHGHGPSVARLRKHGVGATEIESWVSGLKLRPLRRRGRTKAS